MTPKNVKFIVTVPTSHADSIREAIGQVGAGRIGNYDFCSFSVSGTGRFKGNEQSNPSVGKAGEYESVEEERIEVTVPFEIINEVITVVKSVHPYEEVAYDISSVDGFIKPMKENTLFIIINLPIEVVFEYTTNPDNTHKWINSIQTEQVNENPIKVGTEYKNTSDGKNWTTYIVTTFIPNQVFELQEKDGNYFVRYSYEKISENKTKLIYHEWNYTKGLSAPFEQDVLDNLKLVIENKNQD